MERSVSISILIENFCKKTPPKFRRRKINRREKKCKKNVLAGSSSKEVGTTTKRSASNSFVKNRICKEAVKNRRSVTDKRICVHKKTNKNKETAPIVLFCCCYYFVLFASLNCLSHRITLRKVSKEWHFIVKKPQIRKKWHILPAKNFIYIFVNLFLLLSYICLLVFTLYLCQFI